MLKLLTYLLVAILTFPSLTLAQGLPHRDMSAFWLLDEVSGSRADRHAANTLTDNNTVTQAAGRYKSSIAGQFTAANSEVLYLPDNAAMSTGDITFTVACWSYIDSTLANGATRITARKGSEYELNLIDNDGGAGVDQRLRFQVGSQTATWSAAALNATWYLAIGTHRGGATDQVGIQVNNGAEVTAAAVTPPSDGTVTFSVGATDTATNPWDGRISKCGFWKKDLSTQERTDLYNAGNGNLYNGTAFRTDTGGTLPTSLQAWFELDELCCTRFDKVSPGVGPAGQFTAASSEYLSVADNAAVSTGDIDFTVTAWVYLDSKAVNRVFLSRMEVSTANDEYNFTYNSGVDRFQFTIFNSVQATVGEVNANSLGSPTTATWYLLVAWHDSVNNTVNVQANNGTVDNNATTGFPSDLNAPLRIGARNATPTNFMDGRIALAGFWKRVLTSAERTSLYNAGNGFHCKDWTDQLRRGAISCWPLNEGSLTRYDWLGANDLADNNTVTQATGVAGGNSLGDNATVTHNRGLAFFDSTAVGNSGQFTVGTTEYLSVADNAALSVADIEFTGGAIVYLDSVGADRLIMAKGTAETAGNHEYILWYDTGGTVFRWSVSAAGSAQGVDLKNGGVPVANVWYLVEGWHDSTWNVVCGRVNGGSPNCVPFTVGSQDTAAAFNVGGLNGTLTFNGRIDQPFFIKRVLTERERRLIYNEGFEVDYETLQRIIGGRIQ